MDLRIFVICLCLISGADTFADEPQSLNEPSLKDLLAKIEKLEQRIKDLEATRLPPAVYQYNALSSPVIQTPATQTPTLPPFIQQYVPVDPKSPRRLLDRPSIQVTPRPTMESVPNTWRRHEFNGSYYYTVPLSSSNAQSKVF